MLWISAIRGDGRQLRSWKAHRWAPPKPVASATSFQRVLALEALQLAERDAPDCIPVNAKSMKTKYIRALERAKSAQGFGVSAHQGMVSFSQRVNPPVGPSGPSRATRTASRAPSSTVSVPEKLLRAVLVKPGETALT